MGTLPKQYINQAGFAAQAGIARQGMIHRMDSELVPPPDVYVGNVVVAGKAIPGWSQPRITAYLAFIRPYLLKLTDRRRLRLPASLELPPWWAVCTEWFLNQKEVADQLGLQPVSVSVRLARGTFPVPVRVIIGDKSHGQAQGWDRDEVLEYGRQDTYLDGDNKIADVGRKGPPRKAINPAFYAERAVRQHARQAA